MLKVIYQFFHSLVDVINTATPSAVVTDGELRDNSSVGEQCDGDHLRASDREYTVEEKQASFEDRKYVGQQKYKDSFDESLDEKLDTTMIEKDITAKEYTLFLWMRGLILLNAKAMLWNGRIQLQISSVMVLKLNVAATFVFKVCKVLTTIYIAMIDTNLLYCVNHLSYSFQAR